MMEMTTAAAILGADHPATDDLDLFLADLRNTYVAKRAHELTESERLYFHSLLRADMERIVLEGRSDTAEAHRLADAVLAALEREAFYEAMETAMLRHFDRVLLKGEPLKWDDA